MGPDEPRVSRVGPIAYLLRAMRVPTWLQREKEGASFCESLSRTSFESAWPGMRLQCCLRTESFDGIELMFCVCPCLVTWGSLTQPSFPITPGGLIPVGCY